MSHYELDEDSDTEKNHAGPLSAQLEVVMDDENDSKSAFILAKKNHLKDMNDDVIQCCHDLGLTRSDPDLLSSDLTLIDGVMIGQGPVRNFYIWEVLQRPTLQASHSCTKYQDK